MLLPILGLGAVSFVLSWCLTWGMLRVAPKIGLVDKPGGRKIHENVKPLGGGVAIFLALAIPVLVGLGYVRMRVAVMDSPSVQMPANPMEPYLRGAVRQTSLALSLLGGMLVMHLMGLADDRRALGPFVKLIVQLIVATVLVVSFRELRALTALTFVPSVVLTVMWIVAITNAFNFLDNMDGLSAGVAAVCTTAFLITALIIQQWFVAATLALLLGAVLGFLYWNFPPAKIFMGDSGSLVIGFVLGVLTIRTQYLRHGADWGGGWYAVLAPVIVLALPLYDLIVVSIIRISRGKSPFVGDTNHFSHRLVARGMSKRTAVLCLYLITATTSVGAILLPHVDNTFAAFLIFVQTLLVLGVVALLEQHPLPMEKSQNAISDLKSEIRSVGPLADNPKSETNSEE